MQCKTRRNTWNKRIGKRTDWQEKDRKTATYFSQRLGRPKDRWKKKQWFLWCEKMKQQKKHMLKTGSHEIFGLGKGSCRSPISHGSLLIFAIISWSQPLSWRGVILEFKGWKHHGFCIGDWDGLGEIITVNYYKKLLLKPLFALLKPFSGKGFACVLWWIEPHPYKDASATDTL